MTIEDTTQSAIHALWDELADFDAVHTEAARNHLMGEICRLIGASDALWSGWVRLDDVPPEDSTKGWRMRIGRSLCPSRLFDRATKELFDFVESGRKDPILSKLMAEVGHYRVNLLDARYPEGLPDRMLFHELGYPYAIWAGIPVNEDAEVLFTFLRGPDQSMFGSSERDVVDSALRGLKWFHRRLLLSEGIGVASGPLSPMERQVLHSLLQGRTEKQIAGAHGHSPHTTHEYVKRVFRKYGVTSRAQLMALWLGKALQPAPPE